MTQKEKLYEQLLIATNERNALIGLNPIDIEAEKITRKFSINASVFTIAELKSKIEAMRKAIEKAKTDKVREEYWATPEGAMRKAELENEEAILKGDLLYWGDKYKTDAGKLLRDNLPECWKVKCDDLTYIKIYLTDENGLEIFGHNFEIRHSDDYDFNTKTSNYYISSNIGTMGSFDILNDAYRVNLYATYGAILSNKVLITRLLKMTNEWVRIKRALRDKIREINRQIENPSVA